MLTHHTLIRLILCITGAISISSANAENPQTQAIEKLGYLNGVALHCKYLEHTQQIKQSLITNLPKERVLGELFDRSTNQAFLDFIQENNHCPPQNDFAAEVTAAIQALKDSHP